MDFSVCAPFAPLTGKPRTCPRQGSRSLGGRSIFPLSHHHVPRAVKSLSTASSGPREDRPMDICSDFCIRFCPVSE